MSNTSTELAILGGAPAFSEDNKKHVGKPNIGDADAFRRRQQEIFDSRWFTNDGKFVRHFEERIRNYTDVKHCVAVCNATIGLELVAHATGMRGEVIVPSFTFVATAHALQWVGITPIFCDIDPATHNLDPAKIEVLITDRTTGIIPVHVWGRPCDDDRISVVAKRHGLKLVYDAAHAFGCSYNGKRVGNMGAAEVFSFHATKFLNSFEGGAVVTNDDELAYKLRRMRNFGFAGYDSVESEGTNAKMTEICAAMGITSLESIDELIGVNRANYECYLACLRHTPGIRVAEYDASQHPNYQYVVLEVDENAAGINRDHITLALHAENILARRYFYPGCHQMPPYSSANADANLPETASLTKRVMALPNGTSITTDDVQTICAVLSRIVDCAPAVCANLAPS